jgi:uncharacterized membrane protein SirB2
VLELAEWLQTTPVSVTIQSVTWAIPVLQSIHILMIGVVFVSILMIALRVLGRVRTDETFYAVWRRFAPWMWCGLVVMAVTGLTLIIGEPIREFTALSFWLKMALIVSAVTCTVVFARTVKPAGGAADAEFSLAAKSAVVAALVVWIAIIFLGRAIAYDAAVWGSLSPSA